MTSLEKAIKHYGKIVKTNSEGFKGNLKAHYALGALEVLSRVQEVRNSYREEMKRLWKDRGNEAISNLYYQNREIVNSLDNLMIGTPPNG